MIFVEVEFESGDRCDYVANTMNNVRVCAGNHTAKGMFGSEIVSVVEVTEKIFRSRHEPPRAKDAIIAIQKGSAEVYALVITQT